MDNSFIGLVHDFMQGNEVIEYMDDVFEEHNLPRCEKKFPLYFLTLAYNDFYLDEYDFAEDENGNQIIPTDLKPWQCLRKHDDGHSTIIKPFIDNDDLEVIFFNSNPEAKAFTECLDAFSDGIAEVIIYDFNEEDFNSKVADFVLEVNQHNNDFYWTLWNNLYGNETDE